MNGNGCSATSTCVSINNVGVDELTAKDQFAIYPNPTRDQLSILFPGKALMEIVNVEGQVVKSILYEGKIMEIDLTDMPTGIYVIRAKSGKEVITKTFIKK